MDSYSTSLLILILLSFLIMGCAFIVLGALGTALQGQSSPTIFTTVTALSTTISFLLPLSHPMLSVWVAIVFSAVGLLLTLWWIPSAFKSELSAPLSLHHKVCVTSAAVIGGIVAHIMHSGDAVLKSIGMTDSWEIQIQGFVLALFAEFCIGLACGVFCVMAIRIRDEWSSSRKQSKEVI